MNTLAADITIEIDETEVEASAEFYFERGDGGDPRDPARTPASVEITRITDGTRDLKLPANQLRAIEASLLRDMENAA